MHFKIAHFSLHITSYVTYFLHTYSIFLINLKHMSYVMLCHDGQVCVSESAAAAAAYY